MVAVEVFLNCYTFYAYYLGQRVNFQGILLKLSRAGAGARLGIWIYSGAERNIFGSATLTQTKKDQETIDMYNKLNNYSRKNPGLQIQIRIRIGKLDPDPS